MPELTKLCSIEEVAETGAVGAYVEANGQEQNVIVVIDQDSSSPDNSIIRAYRNVCPHVQTPLETFPNDFLDVENPGLLICSTHGARFQVRDGVCVSGPCLGQALKAVTIKIRGNNVYLQDA